MDKYTFTRKELYDLVWSKPMSSIAKEYAISDSGLRKICIRMEIPLPLTGHWSKIKFGKEVKVVKLSKNFKGEKSITLTQREGEYKVEKLSPFSKLKKDIEAIKTLSFKVPNRLSNPDKLVVDASISLAKNKPSMMHNQEGLISTDSNQINIIVSQKNIKRSLRFMNALIKLLNKRGHKVIINHNGTTEVIINEEEISIRLKEKLKKIIVDDGNWRTHRFEPDGKLFFNYGGFGGTNIIDGKKLLLEDRLSYILTKLELKAIELKKQRIEREAWHKQYEEENKRKKHQQELQDNELNKFKNLFVSAKLLHKANIIREYTNAVKLKAIENNNLTEKTKQWIKWANNKANWYDPLIDFDDDLLDAVNKETLEFKNRYRY